MAVELAAGVADGGEPLSAATNRRHLKVSGKAGEFGELRKVRFGVQLIEDARGGSTNGFLFHGDRRLTVHVTLAVAAEQHEHGLFTAAAAASADFVMAQLAGRKAEVPDVEVFREALGLPAAAGVLRLGEHVPVDVQEGVAGLLGGRHSDDDAFVVVVALETVD